MSNCWKFLSRSSFMVSSKLSRSPLRQLDRQFRDIAISDPVLEFIARVGAHLLVDTVQTFRENLDVVLAIDVLPDILDHFDNSQWLSARLFDLEIRNVLKVAEQCSVETIEHDEL